MGKHPQGCVFWGMEALMKKNELTIQSIDKTFSSLMVMDDGFFDDDSSECDNKDETNMDLVLFVIHIDNDENKKND